MKKIALLILFTLLCVSHVVYAQTIQANEQMIVSWFEDIKETQSDSAKIQLNKKIEQLLYTTLQEPNAFNYSFPALKYIGSVYAPDKLMRVFSWNYPLSNGKYGYSALFMFKNKQKSTPSLHLVSTTTAFKPEETRKYDPSTWYGALYYNVIAHKISRDKTEYLLLGISNYQPITKVKIIESIKISNRQLTFGTPLFKKDKKTLYRAVFEYKKEVNMLLEYESSKKRFVFDHLSPSDPIYKDVYHFYGPDFSYDSYQWKKKKLHYTPDIDVRNK